MSILQRREMYDHRCSAVGEILFARYRQLAPLGLHQQLLASFSRHGGKTEPAFVVCVCPKMQGGNLDPAACERRLAGSEKQPVETDERYSRDLERLADDFRFDLGAVATQGHPQYKGGKWRYSKGRPNRHRQRLRFHFKVP